MKYTPKVLALVSLGFTLALSVLPGAAGETDSQGLASFDDRVSYSIGHKLGVRFKEKTEIKIDPFLQGIRDALSDNESPLTAEEMKGLLETFAAKQREKEKKLLAELSEKNLQEGEKFLAENATKEGVTVLPSGLQYKVLNFGSGKTPGKSDRVSAHYRGTFVDGIAFGNTHSQGKPASFALDSVIDGWAEALQLMKEGDKWQLFIPADLAYGERGRMPRIEPNKALIFEVELVAVESEEAAPGEPASGS